MTDVYTNIKWKIRISCISTQMDLLQQESASVKKCIQIIDSRSVKSSLDSIGYFFMTGIFVLLSNSYDNCKCLPIRYDYNYFVIVTMCHMRTIRRSVITSAYEGTGSSCQWRAQGISCRNSILHEGTYSFMKLLYHIDFSQKDQYPHCLQRIRPPYPHGLYHQIRCCFLLTIVKLVTTLSLSKILTCCFQLKFYLLTRPHLLKKR